MIADHIIRTISPETTADDLIPVPFEWFELEKKRIRKTAQDGTEIGVCIEEPLHPGDIIAEEGSRSYVVSLLPSHLIRTPVHTMEEMGRLGFELGNRHLSLKITSDSITVPYDEPTFLYLKKLGFAPEEIHDTFADFIVCKGHGDHGHEHNHDHAHSK